MPAARPRCALHPSLAFDVDVPSDLPSFGSGADEHARSSGARPRAPSARTLTTSSRMRNLAKWACFAHASCSATDGPRAPGILTPTPVRSSPPASANRLLPPRLGVSDALDAPSTVARGDARHAQACCIRAPVLTWCRTRSVEAIPVAPRPPRRRSLAIDGIVAARDLTSFPDAACRIGRRSCCCSKRRWSTISRRSTTRRHAKVAVATAASGAPRWRSITTFPRSSSDVSATRSSKGCARRCRSRIQQLRDSPSRSSASPSSEPASPIENCVRGPAGPLRQRPSFD